MKKIILLVIFSISMFASTHYKTPVFVVQNSELYCATINGIVVHQVGDVISGDSATTCAYDRNIAESKIKVVKEANKAREEINKSFINTMYFILFLICLAFGSMIGLMISLDKKD